jgi:potassium voltage-gated channel Eag-related subfamily H protein 8
MITTVIVMMLGVAFFSYIMGNILEIVENQQKKMGSVDKSDEFNHWLTALTRFTMNQPLPNSLYERLAKDMIYHSQNDRKKCFEG